MMLMPALGRPYGTIKLYGLLVKLTANTGKRERLIELLLDTAIHMLGCFSYIVAKDAADESVIWVTEAWVSVTSHEASLTVIPFREKCLISSQISCRHFRRDGSQLSNCGIPVEAMDTSFKDKSSKHNIDSVKCIDGHARSVPCKTSNALPTGSLQATQAERTGGVPF